MGKVCGVGLRFLHKERAHLFSLSLLLSSGIRLALRGGERPQRERERERETEERLCTRANSFSLFLFGARFLSRRSGFPTGEGSRKRRGDKEREREKGFIANENAQKRAKYGPDDFDVALVVSSSSARTFYNNTANDDFKSVLPPVCPVTFGAFLRPNVPAGHQRATAKIHLSNRDE